MAVSATSARVKQKVQVQLNEINPCLVGLCPDCHVVVEWLAHGQLADEPLWI
jgi:hypothetical protein